MEEPHEHINMDYLKLISLVDSSFYEKSIIK